MSAIAGPRALNFFCLLLAGISVWGISAAYVNHDAAWYLHVAERWLQGGVLYRDRIDTNPPLIILLTTLPVALAWLTGFSAPATFKAVVLVASAGAIAASTWILRRLFRDDETRWAITAVLVFLILPFAGADFGQREHITVLLVLPYVLASAAGAAGAPLSGRFELLTAGLAALGFAMKPQFIVAWLALEFCTAIVTPPQHRKWLRPSALLVCGLLLLYTLAVLLLVPQYLQVVSDVRRVYGALDSPVSALARLPDLRVWGSAIVVAIIARLNAATSRASLCVLATATGFLVAALAQRKGWAYHLYPFRVLIGLYAAVVLGGLLESRQAVTQLVRGGPRFILAAVCALLLYLTVRAVPTMAAPAGSEQIQALEGIVLREGARSMAVLSMRTILFPAFPVVNYTGVRWVLRQHSLWFLPGLYAAAEDHSVHTVVPRALAAMPSMERRLFEEIVEDLCADPPDLLVIETPLAQGRGWETLDLLTYYGQDERFRRLFVDYRQGDRFGAFVAHVRTSKPSCESG